MDSKNNLLNALIVDDKMLAIELLERFAIQSQKFNQIIKTNQPEHAIELVKKNKIDLIFLDIHMPQMTGIELLMELPYRPAIIFTTAYTEYATSAFDLDAVDYLLKPFSYDRFLKSVEKAISYHKKHEQEDTSFITIKHNGDFQKLLIRDIIYIEGKKDYVKFYCEQNKSYTTLKKLSTLEKELGHHTFIRTHKSFILSIRKIVSFNNEEVMMNNGFTIPISRMKKSETMQLLRGL